MIKIENIIQVINNVVPSAQLTVNDIDVELRIRGVDSLDLFNVLLELENQTSIEVPDEELPNLKTLRALLGYFNSSR